MTIVSKTVNSAIEDFVTPDKIAEELKKDSFGHWVGEILDKHYPNNPENNDVLILLVDLLECENEAHCQLRESIESEYRGRLH